MGEIKGHARYGDYLSRISVNFQSLSYNALTPRPELAADGSEKPYSPPKVKLRTVDVYNLLTPYISSRFREQLKAVMPLGLYLAFFQLLALQVKISEPFLVLNGFLAVVGGLMMFMEGLKVGVMPLGGAIGDKLPAKASLPVFVMITLALGVGVTLAEPAMGSLKIAGATLKPEDAPYLYAILNDWQLATVAVVGGGVGIAAAVGSMRFVYGWGLKPLIFIAIVPALLLTAYAMGDDRIRNVIGFAWDCGAVTTGPVTVPIVLSLGIGIAGVAGKGDYPLSGFGIVTLASILPIVGVLGLAVYLAETTPVEIIMEKARLAAVAAPVGAQAIYNTPPFSDMLAGLQAVAPVLIFLMIVMRVGLREKFREPQMLAYGIVLTLLGMMMFNIGLTYGLSKLGAQSGGIAPAAFVKISGVSGSPFYNWWTGVALTVAFAGILGFGATIAEPALSAMGMTIENLTNGAYKKSFLIYSVSFGVGLGVLVGVLRMITGTPLAHLLLPGYVVALTLTLLSTEEFVNIAWDSAAVTTGPVTVPLILAIGLGFGGALGADGFGILAMASLFPIITVLCMGLWIKWTIIRSHR